MSHPRVTPVIPRRVRREVIVNARRLAKRRKARVERRPHNALRSFFRCAMVQVLGNVEQHFLSHLCLCQLVQYRADRMPLRTAQEREISADRKGFVPFLVVLRQHI